MGEPQEGKGGKGNIIAHPRFMEAANVFKIRIAKAWFDAIICLAAFDFSC
jgi:hypothetical protein